MKERDELIEKFSPHEVETVEELLHCMKQPPTTDKFRRMLMLFLRGHYSSTDNYLDFDHLKCFVWHADEKLRTLEIEFSHQGDDSKPDAYPGIYIGFSGVKFEKGGIGSNFAGTTQDTAGTHMSKIASATFVISHIAANASDANDLAEMSSRVLTAMAKPLAMNSGATGFEVTGYAPPKEKNPAPRQYYAVAMPVEISYTHAVTRSLESHRIRRIAQVINTET
jgi:hypothetical protein